MTNVKWHIFYTVFLIFFFLLMKKKQIPVITSHNSQHQIRVHTRPTANGCFPPEGFKFHQQKSVTIERLQLFGGRRVVWVFCWFFLFIIISSAICVRRTIQLCDKAHLHTHKDAQRDSGMMGNSNSTLLSCPQTHHRSHQTTEDQFR